MKRGNQRKFKRVRNQRAALYKSLATALIEHGKIKTTEAKGKSISHYVEKLVSQAKTDTISKRRLLSKNLGPKAISHLFKDVAPKFSDKKNGFTRVIKLGQRKSDGSPMVIVEFTHVIPITTK